MVARVPCLEGLISKGLGFIWRLRPVARTRAHRGFCVSSVMGLEAQDRDEGDSEWPSVISK